MTTPQAQPYAADVVETRDDGMGRIHQAMANRHGAMLAHSDVSPEQEKLKPVPAAIGSARCLPARRGHARA